MHEMTTTLTDNPLYNPSWPPNFPEIDAAHVVPAVTAMLDLATAGLPAVEAAAAPTWRAAVEAVDALERPLGDAWRIVSHLMGVRNTPELRAAHDEVLPKLVQYQLRVGQSRPIFEALEGLANSDTFAELTPAQQRVVDARLRGMKLSGVGLEGDARERFNAISTTLSATASAFRNNVLDATKAWDHVVTDRAALEGLTNDELAQLAQSYSQANDGAEATAEAGPWRLSLDYPAVRPIFENGKDRSIREKVYRAYVGRASEGALDNSDNIARTLALRHESAALLGFSTYAEMAMTRKMADVESALDLLKSLRDASYAPGKKELEQLTAFAHDNGFEGALAPWDLRFWRMRLREAEFSFTDEELRPYFPLPRVLDGLFGVVERMFGVQVVAADGEVPVWHPDVRYFRVQDGGETIAAFFLDAYSRPENKSGGAWMAPAMSRRRIDGVLDIPVTYLICNGTPPVGDRPSLMSFNEVVTLFHEFGHGLQHMLTEVDVEDVSGTSGVEWDAVELPSQFMENWCYHRATIKGMTAHIETGESLPDDLFDKLLATRTFFTGSDFLRQLTFGLTDLTLHTASDPSAQAPLDVYREISAATVHVAPIAEDKFLNAFSHIFAGGYAAGYYSYKWAEVLSADAFAAFEEVGLDDDDAVGTVGGSFRETVLALGGSVPPAEVYRRFRGRDATVDALLRHNGLA